MLIDLEPISRSYANECLELTKEDARNLSGANAIARTNGALVLAYSDGEPAGFESQSKAFHPAWLNAGNGSKFLEIPKRHHFDIILDLADARSKLFRSVRKLIEPSISKPP